MKKVLLMVILCAVVVGTGGCIVSIKGDCESRRDFRDPALDSTIAEIDAVKMLASESARLNVLRTIAHRPGLAPEARMHLIESTRLLASESAREEVLMILAENPPMIPEPMPQPCDDDD